jgi:RNA recognition motif-containing protein
MLLSPLVQTDRLWLYEKFAPFGGVMSVRVLSTETGICRGVGFINYADPDSAARAVAAMNGMPVGGERRLYVALQTHRQQQQQQQMSPHHMQPHYHGQQQQMF